MFIILLASLFIALLLEATVISLPLAFVLLLCYSVLNRSGKVLLTAFASGFILDVLTLRMLGASAIFFVLFFSFVLLYQSKYEIRSYPFVIVSAFAGSYLYLLLLSGSATMLRAIVSSIMAVLIFGIGRKLKGKG